MKGIIVFCAVIVLGATKPNGYYHQEYNYKSSSASFKNNELQHKNEDEGFYSKDGDLEGRLKPKVNSHSQHAEYTNPKLVGGSSNFQGTGGYSSGNYLAGSDRLFGSNQNALTSGAVDGYASSDRIVDLSNIYTNRAHGSSQGAYGTSVGGYLDNQGYRRYGSFPSAGYGSSLGGGSQIGYTQAGGSYGYTQAGSQFGTSGIYGANSNLNSLAQRLQDQMSRQLETAVYNQYRSSGYSTSTGTAQMTENIRALEDELKRNLTRQLEESLQSQYGQQIIRDSNHYTTIEGRPSTVVNYNNQEIADLTRRLEDDLIKKLHQNIRTTYSKESTSSYTSSNNIRQPTNYIISSTYRPVVIVPSNIRYTPISNPQSITQIYSKMQGDINSYLDNALRNLYSTYLQSGRTTSSYYSLTDFNNEANRIRDDILRNLTMNLEDQIRRNYGQQILKGEYYYSVSSNGDVSSQYNYNIKDFDNLRKQVEQNLLRKLNETVNTYRQQYQRQQSYSTNTNTYTVTYRPIYYTSGDNTGYDYSDLQRQLSQQLQNALNQHRYSQSSTYSSSSSYNPQAYQTSFDQLSRELQRNLTEQMRTLQAQSASSSSGYGHISGTSGGDFESMKNQLQNQLMQQLQQGLQKQYHYSASASYSASSSSSSNSNYGGHQSYGNNANYMECCQGDDPSVYDQGRHKRDLSYLDSPEIGSFRSSSSQRRYANRRHFFSEEERDNERNFRNPFQRNYDQTRHTYPSNYELTNSRRHHNGGYSQRQFENTDIFSPQYSHADQDLLQQVENDSNQELESLSHTFHKKNDYTRQESQQQLEDANQDLTYLDNNQKPSDQVQSQLQDDLNYQRLEDQNDLTQQSELFLGEQKQNSQEKLTFHAAGNLNQHSGQQLEDQDVFPALGLSVPDKVDQQQVQNQLLDQNVQDDLTQQLEMDAAPQPKRRTQKLELLPVENVHAKSDDQIEQNTNTDQQLQEQDDIVEKPKQTQNLDLLPVENVPSQTEKQVKQNTNIDQQLQEQDDLTQQLEQDDKRSDNQQLEQNQLQEADSFDQTQSKLSGALMHGQIEQNLVDQTDLDQQLELDSSPRKNNLENQQTQLNLDQQLELDTSSKRGDLENQQRQQLEMQSKKDNLENQQTQQLEALDQQLLLNESDIKTPENKPNQEQQLQQVEDDTNQLKSNFPNNQQTEDLSQQLELTKTIEQQTTDQEIQKPKYHTDTEILPQKHADQTNNGLTQQLELLGSIKPKNEQTEQNSGEFPTQNLQLTNEQKTVDLQIDHQKQDEQVEQETDSTQQLQISHIQKPVPFYEQQEKDNVPKLQKKIESINQVQQSTDQKNGAQNYLEQSLQEQDQTQQLIHEPKISKVIAHELGQSTDQQLELTVVPQSSPGKNKKPKNVEIEDQKINLAPEQTTKDIGALTQQTIGDLQQLEIPFEHHSQYSSGSKVITQSTASHSGSYSSQVLVPEQQQKIHATQDESEQQRSFTNAHSGHANTLNLENLQSVTTYDQALRQQEALINLLRQKSINQNSYGGNWKTHVTESERKNKLIQEQFHAGAYGHRSEQELVHTRPYPTNGMYPFQWQSFPGFGMNSQINDFPSNGRRTSQITQKSTKRVFHFENGKPISASENIEIIKPNGEIERIHHDLPLNNNLLETYTNSFSPNLLANNLGHPPSTAFINYGIESPLYTTQSLHNIRKSVKSSKNEQFGISKNELAGFNEGVTPTTCEFKHSPPPLPEKLRHIKGYHTQAF